MFSRLLLYETHNNVNSQISKFFSYGILKSIIANKSHWYNNTCQKLIQLLTQQQILILKVLMIRNQSWIRFRICSIWFDLVGKISLVLVWFEWKNEQVVVVEQWHGQLGEHFGLEQVCELVLVVELQQDDQPRNQHCCEIDQMGLRMGSILRIRRMVGQRNHRELLELLGRI